MREMAQRNVEWYSVHTNGVELRKMTQRNVEWYSAHTNSVALREMAQRNVEWYSVDTNGVALGRIALWNIRRSIWTLNCLVLLEIFRCCGESSSLLVAWREGHAIPLLAMLYCSGSLNHLCICWSIWHPCIVGGDGRQGYLAETTKNTNCKWNSYLLGAWRHQMWRLPRNHASHGVVAVLNSLHFALP